LVVGELVELLLRDALEAVDLRLRGGVRRSRALAGASRRGGRGGQRATEGNASTDDRAVHGAPPTCTGRRAARLPARRRNTRWLSRCLGDGRAIAPRSGRRPDWASCCRGSRLCPDT